MPKRISQQFTGLFHKLSTASGRFPPTVLSLRGWIVFAGISLLLLGPVFKENDIVSASLCWGAMGLLFLLALGTLVASSRLEKVSYEVVPPGDMLTAGRSFLLVVRTSPLRVLPFWTVSAFLKSDHEGLDLPIFRLKGSKLSARTLAADVMTAHRGEWQIKEAVLEISDSLGLTTSRVVIDVPPRSLRTYPPKREVESLPIISSSERPGDAITDMNNRQGEYFDLKPYHPADGTHRIAWKVFARRGELLSRHPEPSMTPEGQVIMIVCAFRQDDELGGVAVAYADSLTEMGLHVFATCLGARNFEPARNGEELRELLVDSVWNKYNADVNALLSNVKAVTPNVSIARVILMCSASQLVSEDQIEAISGLASELTSLRIEPVFLIPDLSTGIGLASAAQKRKKRGLIRRLITTSMNNSAKEDDINLSPKLVNICLSNKWRVMER